jgi:hypothetical protein
MEFINPNNIFTNTLTNVGHEKYMHISIFVDGDEELKNKYIKAANKHNNKIINNPEFYDAGFDLFLPKNDINVYGEGKVFFGEGWDWNNSTPINKVDFKVKCCAKMVNMLVQGKRNWYYTPFYTYVRSSMSKTPLRLANNQGIIDAGYRGSLIGMFDCIRSDNSYNKEFDWYMEEYSRMLQICAPNLVPVYVNIVDSIEELGPSTERGQGGFGSTGI